MTDVHISLHAQPPGVEQADPRTIDGAVLRPLRLAPNQMTLPMAISFEDAEHALAQLPRMFVEPDGSFVWVSSGESRWQLDGNLYDHHDRLLTVDIKGMCDGQAWKQLLQALGHSQQPLMVQLVHQSLFLREEEFRYWWDWQREASAQQKSRSSRN